MATSVQDSLFKINQTLEQANNSFSIEKKDYSFVKEKQSLPVISEQINFGLQNDRIKQTREVTMAKYNYSVYAKRIFYYIISKQQDFYKVNGIQGKLDFNIMSEYVEICFSDLAGKSRNNSRYKKGLMELVHNPICRLVNYQEVEEITQTKVDEEDKNGEWIDYFNLIERIFIFNEKNDVIFNVKQLKYLRKVKIKLSNPAKELLCDFTKGYNAFNIQTALSFSNVKSQRLYEILSGYVSNNEYTFSFLYKTIKHLLLKEGNDFFSDMDENCDENMEITEYDQFPNFIIGLDLAIKELKEKCPYYLEYKVEKKNRIQDNYLFVFFIKKNPKFTDSILVKKFDKKTRKEFELNNFFSENQLNYLHKIGLSQQELKNNMEVIIEYFNIKSHSQLTFCKFVSEVKSYIDEQEYSNNPIKNPNGYIINCLKKELGITIEKEF